MKKTSIVTQACIVGGGPAGMMAGLLLARAGVEVVVLEKHKDFFRDFRGDTVHPATLELLHELGMLQEFLKRPHQELRKLDVQFGTEVTTICDFSHLPTHCRFMAIMPQWDFLDLIAQEAKKYGRFQLIMEANVTQLIIENKKVLGVKAIIPSGLLDVRAELTLGTDGRHSIVRSCAKLPIYDIGAPIDVLWMQISRRSSDREQPLARFNYGSGLATITRGTYYQCGLLIKKGGLAEIKKKGLPALRRKIVQIAPSFRDRIGELKSWDDIKHLSVEINRLRQWWRPGLLCIGDAAHAMGPQGGIGINLAIQDAVAVANMLAKPLRSGLVTTKHLRSVQKRREFPTRFYQGLQRILQKRVFDKAFENSGKPSPPWSFRLFQTFPILQRIPARIIWMGARPEHIH
ncbi:MAG: FAD-dependent oxidoreductase [Bdellovibrionia bacterium]